MRKTELLAFLQNQTDFFDPDNLSEVFTASWRPGVSRCKEIPPAIISISWSLRTCW